MLQMGFLILKSQIDINQPRITTASIVFRKPVSHSRHVRHDGLRIIGL
ncbi:hypothetical protein DW66_5876 [Pseudomonas putida]|nr:hypothetical protein DW66_5876 [Pseudomonas putida]